MPFLDDIGPRDEPRSPVWEAFAALADQVERMVAVNVGWSIQLLPGVLALAFPEWPLWLRCLLAFYTVVVIVPATGTLYGVAAQAGRRQHVSLDLVKELLRELTVPSLRALAPLYVSTAIVSGGLVVAQSRGLDAIAAGLTLVLLLWSVPAMYWGPLLASDPQRSPIALARHAIRLTWRAPGRSFLCWIVVLLAVVLGAISVGGLFLVVPVVVTLFQTCYLAYIKVPNPSWS